MAIEAVTALAAKEIGVQAVREAATQVASEIAQKMATEAGTQGAGREIQTAMMERQTMQEGFRIGEMPESKGEGREVFKQMEADTAEELRNKLDAEEIRPQQESEAIHLPQSPSHDHVCPSRDITKPARRTYLEDHACEACRPLDAEDGPA